MKKEKQKQSLYGYIESSILLNTGEKPRTSSKRQTGVSGGSQAQLVHSKIIGNFVPRNSSNVQRETSQGTVGSSTSDKVARILELMERATAAINVTNKF